MSRKIRSGLFFAFIVTFVVATSIISLSASGYRLNLAWPPQFNRLLIKTGMIIVSSLPSGATIYINDKPIPSSNNRFSPKKYLNTEAKIKNLLPGEYLLRLERDGYWTWEKTITVHPGQTSHILNVNLFRTDQPHLILPAQAKELKLSPSRRYLYASQEEKIISLRSGEFLSLEKLPLKNEMQNKSTSRPAGIWQKNSDELLIGNRLFSPTQGLIADYNNLIGEGEKIRFDNNNERIYYLNKGSLAYLNPTRQTITTVLSQKNILDYEPRGDIIWYLSYDNGLISLNKYSLPDEKNEVYRLLTANGEYEFKSDQKKWLTIYDTRHQTLHLINPDLPLNNVNLTLIGQNNLLSGILSIDDVLSWQWLNDNTLLYHNQWEIYRLDLKSGSSYLLTRLSQKIKEIIWQANRNYLIVLTNQGLFAYDLRLETLTNIFLAENIISPVMDNSANALYFQARIEEQDGIYRLRLQ